MGERAGIASQPTEATRDLYERYGRQIFAYCVTQLRNREDAEDAVQSTFLNAFRGLERGVVPELESAWLHKIAQHVCLTRRRSWSRRRSVESPEDFETAQDLVGSPMRDTDDLSALTAALRTLPEQQRRAILLREWQGLTYKEIATEMQLSQASVETLIFRARRSLARALERLRGSVDLGSIFAAAKSLLFGAGTKVALTVATVATSSVVASTPQARHDLVHFVDAVSNNVAAAVTPKPRHPHVAAVVTDAVAGAAPAATATPVLKTVGPTSAERHATPAPERTAKKSPVEAPGAAHAAAAAEPPVPVLVPAAVPPAVDQPAETAPAQTITTPSKTSTGSGDDGAQTAKVPDAPAGGPAIIVTPEGRLSSGGSVTITPTVPPSGVTTGPIIVVTPNDVASSDNLTIPAPAVEDHSASNDPAGAPAQAQIGRGHSSGDSTAVPASSNASSEAQATAPGGEPTGQNHTAPAGNAPPAQTPGPAQPTPPGRSDRS